MEIWFGIANGQILSVFDSVICPPTIVTGYYHFTFLFYMCNCLFQALVEVIITTDMELFIRTVILLGELLHLVSMKITF